MLFTLNTSAVNQIKKKFKKNVEAQWNHLKSTDVFPADKLPIELGDLGKTYQSGHLKNMCWCICL